MPAFIQLSAVAVLLILSFIFSGSEVSILSISELDHLKLTHEKEKKFKTLLSYLNAPQKALITILVGNMVVNSSASILGEQLSRSIFSNNPLLYSVIIMTFLILLIGEIVPKNVAAMKPIAFSKTFIPVIHLTYRIFYPFIFLIQGMVKRSSGYRKKIHLSKEELLTAVESGTEAGVHNISITVLKNMIHLIDKPVADVMVPRSQIFGLDIQEYWSRMEECIKESSVSTVLFYQENIDHILGYLKTADFINLRKKDIKANLRKPLFIPETKPIVSMLNEFKESNNYLAVVLDEYGGTAGIVTLKDILDVIFVREIIIKKYIEEMENNRWIIRGNTKISDVNSALHTNLPVESNTIGGYVVNIIGVIPDTGTVIEIEGNFRVTVLKSDKQKIELLEFNKNVR